MSPDLPETDATARRNLVTLFAVSMLIGLGVAVAEVALPLYLKKIGFSWLKMGWVYAVAALAGCAISVGMGAWSDRVGRKRVYVCALLATGLATGLMPFFSCFFIMMALRSVADPSRKAREAMHSVLLYESSPKRFQKLFSRTRGVEFLFHFFGLLAAGGWMALMLRKGMDAAYAWVIGTAAGILILCGAIFAVAYRERPRHNVEKARLSWDDLLRPRLKRPMWILTASMFIFMVGISISHCYALQLFFKEKFQATDGDIFTVGALHRLSCALPLLLVGNVFRRRLKTWLMLFLVFEGIFVAAPALMPATGTYNVLGAHVSVLWAAVGVWLVHDLLGMGVWLPMQHALLQRYSRPESRGKDVTLATALAALGWVFGTFAAGWLREWPGMAASTAVNLPFIVSGAGVILSAFVLLWLPGDDR